MTSPITMTSDGLAFELNLDPAETVRASQELERRGRGSAALRAGIFWFCLAAAGTAVFKGGLVVVEVLAVLFTGLGLWALLWPTLKRRKLRRLYRGMPALSGPQRYEFREDGLAFSNAGAESLLRWSAVLEAAETPEFFLIYYAKKCAYYLPKRVIGSEVLADQLRGFLRGKLGERATHVAPPT